MKTRASTKQTFAESLVGRALPFENFAHELSKFGVYVVRPGETVSGVYFTDERRFFPRINEDDIVVGGYFG